MNWKWGIRSRKRVKYTPFYNDRLLLAGDLHCHSIYSMDGVFSVAQIAHYAKDAGLDFMAITDHNSIGAFADEDNITDMVFIRGSECSLCERCGHFNIFGIDAIDLRPDMTEKDEIVSYMKEMKQRGGVVQLNHPFAGGLGWHVGWDVPFDMIEIWNRDYSTKNANSIAFWHERLCAGEKIPATGGTDSHYTKSERYPINCVYARERTPEAILQAVLEGHNFISECSYGPWIQLKIGTGILGDTVQADERAQLEVFFENLEPDYTVVVLSDQKEELRETPNESFYRAQLPVEKGRKFYRAEVWRGKTLAAISNPIYLDWTESV